MRWKELKWLDKLAMTIVQYSKFKSVTIYLNNTTNISTVCVRKYAMYSYILIIIYYDNKNNEISDHNLPVRQSANLQLLNNLVSVSPTLRWYETTTTVSGKCNLLLLSPLLDSRYRYKLCIKSLPQTFQARNRI